MIVPGLSSVLCEFVSLVYTGLALGLTVENNHHFPLLLRTLDLKSSLLLVIMKIKLKSNTNISF